MTYLEEDSSSDHKGLVLDGMLEVVTAKRTEVVEGSTWREILCVQGFSRDFKESRLEKNHEQAWAPSSEHFHGSI